MSSYYVRYAQHSFWDCLLPCEYEWQELLWNQISAKQPKINQSALLIVFVAIEAFHLILELF